MSPTPYEQWAAEQARRQAEAASPVAPDAETRSEVEVSPTAPAVSGITATDLVAHTHTDQLSNLEVIVFGLVVEVIAPWTDKDGSEAPERARVAWLGGGLSGPIETADLLAV